MKRIFVILFIMLMGTNVLTAQTADDSIVGLINRADWFGLANEYPKLKANMKSNVLKHLSGLMVGYFFNQPDRALQNITWFQTMEENQDYDDGMGEPYLEKLDGYGAKIAVYGFLMRLKEVKSLMLGELGMYTQSTDSVNGDDLEWGGMYQESIPFKIYNKMLNKPKPEIIRPDKDVDIQFTIEQISDDVKLICVPVNINGKEYKLALNTTWPKYTTISQRLASELGGDMTGDSVMIYSSPYRFNIMAMDSLNVGGITFKNPIVMVSPQDRGLPDTLKCDGALGTDFLKMMGETQIYPSERKIVFPMEKTSLPAYGHNLLMCDGTTYLRAYAGRDTLTLNLVMGNEKTILLDAYYNKHKREVDKMGKRKTKFLGMDVDSYKMATLLLTIGDCNVELNDVNVPLLDGVEITDDFMQPVLDGMLGMDFITTCKEVIINTDDMFVKVVK